jgi:hypothetical protein
MSDGLSREWIQPNGKVIAWYCRRGTAYELTVLTIQQHGKTVQLKKVDGELNWLDDALGLGAWTPMRSPLDRTEVG